MHTPYASAPKQPCSIRRTKTRSTPSSKALDCLLIPHNTPLGLLTFRLFSLRYHRPKQAHRPNHRARCPPLRPNAPSLRQKCPPIRPNAPSLRQKCPPIRPNAPSLRQKCPPIRPNAPSLRRGWGVRGSRERLGRGGDGGRQVDRVRWVGLFVWLLLRGRLADRWVVPMIPYRFGREQGRLWVVSWVTRQGMIEGRCENDKGDGDKAESPCGTRHGASAVRGSSNGQHRLISSRAARCVDPLASRYPSRWIGLQRGKAWDSDLCLLREGRVGVASSYTARCKIRQEKQGASMKNFEQKKRIKKIKKIQRINFCQGAEERRENPCDHVVGWVCSGQILFHSARVFCRNDSRSWSFSRI